MISPTILSEALSQPAAAIAYEMSRRLAELFPDRALLEGSDCDFTLEEYLREGLCTVRRKEAVHGQVAAFWSDEDGVYERPKNVWYEVDWRGHELEVVLLDWNDAPRHFWILAESELTARRFFEAVCAFDPDHRDEVLIYEGGYWRQSEGMLRGIKSDAFDRLVLAGTLKSDIRADLERFFASRAFYERLRAPWKRGLLFTGPPGNGKTHTIKALVNCMKVPCLYVKSFKSERFEEETNIRRIFERARRLSPCLLVLEDLDCLITDANRSFFLNELDGFARNTGIATIASTNHPDRLDPALANRPSRFDRCFHFPLPESDERRAFLRFSTEELPDELAIQSETQDLLVSNTEGFSYAHLKELVLASILVRASDDEQSLAAILRTQVEVLRSQLRVRPSGTTEREEGSSQ